jgi:hypothetical protein
VSVVCCQVEESYRLWCVVVCDLETSGIRGPGPLGAVTPLREVGWEIDKLLKTFHIIHVLYRLAVIILSIYLVCDKMNHRNVSCQILISELFVQL